MRHSWADCGLFWKEEAREKKKGGGYVSSVKPAIKDLGWRPPKELPNLQAAVSLAIDTETFDPDLLTLGPGVRRTGYVVGIAVATNDNHSWYIPIRHDKEYNPNGYGFEREAVVRWAKDNLCRAGQPKLFANAIYDLDYLWEAGVEVQGPYYDVQIAEPLINENARSYSLESLLQKYLGESKTEEEMYLWAAAAYGGAPTRKAQACNIHRIPPELVGPYAIGDVDRLHSVFKKQTLEMGQQDLQEIFDLETRLIPLMLAMRRRGVRVDVEAARHLDELLRARAEEYRRQLGPWDPWSGDSLAQLCDQEGIMYPTTGIGNPSFRSAWLERHENPLMQMVFNIRRMEKFAGTFVEGTIFKNEVNGRIHTQFHQLRSDDSGTVSGRFSSSNPNLQNIPVRDDEIGPLMRGLFIPEDGEIWRGVDWSQIEYRLLVHYGIGKSADRVRQMYHSDPKTDFHVYVSNLAGIDRRPAKSINFGLVYGMGEPAMAANLGKPLDEVRPMFQAYHSEFPFVRKTYDEVSRMAKKRGWIRTILGRRRRFDLWEPTDFELSRKSTACAYEQAAEKWGRHKIRRAYAHKALNALLQGGAADIMKKAMVDIWESGICNTLGAPLLTVHDELNWSCPRTKEADEAFNESVRIMETCVPIRIPLLASTGEGANWGEAK